MITSLASIDVSSDIPEKLINRRIDERNLWNLLRDESKSDGFHSRAILISHFILYRKLNDDRRQMQILTALLSAREI